jgi:hypothetical protein
VQLGQFMAAAGVAQGNRELVADELAAAAGKHRRPVGQVRPLLLAAVSREPSNKAFVWKHGSADRGAADGIGAAAAKQIGRNREKEGQEFEKSLQNEAFSGFPLPGRGGTRPLKSSELLKDKKGTSGNVWVYSGGHSRCQNGNPGLTNASSSRGRSDAMERKSP